MRKCDNIHVHMITKNAEKMQLTLLLVILYSKLRYDLNWIQEYHVNLSHVVLILPVTHRHLMLKHFCFTCK